MGLLTNIEEMRLGSFLCDDKTFPESMNKLDRLKSLECVATFSIIPEFIYGIDSISAISFNFQNKKNKFSKELINSIIRLTEIPSLKIANLTSVKIPRSEIKRIKSAFANAKKDLIILKGVGNFKDYQKYLGYLYK